jgi:hypothetical protein
VSQPIESPIYKSFIITSNHGLTRLWMLISKQCSYQTFANSTTNQFSPLSLPRTTNHFSKASKVSKASKLEVPTGPMVRTPGKDRLREPKTGRERGKPNVHEETRERALGVTGIEGRVRVHSWVSRGPRRRVAEIKFATQSQVGVSDKQMPGMVSLVKGMRVTPVPEDHQYVTHLRTSLSVTPLSVTTSAVAEITAETRRTRKREPTNI